MDLNIMIGVFGLVIGIASLAYAIYVHRKTSQEKKLVYEVLPPVPIADVAGSRDTYSLSIVYEKRGEPPRKLDKALVHYIRFSNLGSVPIRADDVAQNEPIRVRAEGGEVLYMSLLSSTRPVCNIRLGDTLLSRTTALSTIHFDFLDTSDGGLIQILTTEPNTRISIEGTVVGMPDGLVEVHQSSTGRQVSGWGCVPIVALQIAAIAAVPFLYRRITGSWEGIVLLLLPFAALTIPVLLTILTLVAIPHRGKVRFPDLLAPPTWYADRLRMYESGPPPRRHRDGAGGDSGAA